MQHTRVNLKRPESLSLCRLREERDAAGHRSLEILSMARVESEVFATPSVRRLFMPVQYVFYTILMGLLFLAPLPLAHPHAVNGNANHNVEIPDTVLRGIIETRLTKNSGDPITATEMATLDEVVESDQSIHDLTGLEHATALQQVRIGRNRFRFPLSGRTAANSVSDLSPLTNLSRLTDLNFNAHRITDISPLATLTALTDLTLSYNSDLADISHLRGLTSVKNLYLVSCSITDITAIGTLTNLRVLELGSNRNLRDISPLTNLSDLRVLKLNSTAITAEGLSAVLPALEGARRQEPGITYWANLDLTNTDISDLSVLDRIPDGVFIHNLSLQFMGTVPSGTRFLLLKDLTALVDLMNKGKVIGSDTDIRLRWNFRLDYPSLYEDLPVLLASVRRVEYLASTPGLERESPTDEPYRGHPRTRHTFVVRAINNTPFGSYPLERTRNPTFNGVPVTWRVTAPDGTLTETDVVTGDDGLARITLTLGEDGETHTVEAIVPANERAATEGPSHPELKVTFTATADSTVPPPPRTDGPDRLTVTFEDYPEERPIDEFTLTIKFSEPVIGFESEDITVETELTSGKGEATLTALTPETPIHPDRPDPDPIQTYTATVELPDRARGSVTLIVRENAATGSRLLEDGPASDTASDPIKFGRRVIICPPSVVPMDTVIFNEFRNAEDDTHDWIELKNISNQAVSLTDWEVSLVVPHAVGPATPQWEIFAMDRDVVAFGDYTLPPGGILLIVNTHPSETDLIRGQNIENPNRNPDLFPKYLIAPEMKLPSSFLLILRSVRDKNGHYEGFEDLAGDYHKDDVNYATNIWPLRCTPVYTGTAARLTVGDVYQRVMAPKVSARTFVSTLQPEKRGYLEGAWTLSESHGGLGYDPGASVETSLGTPGYPVPGPPSEKGWGSISFSEVMYATNENGGLSQWIELYNRTTEIVDLTDWRLVIEARDSKTVQRWTSLRLKSLHIRSNQTVLLVGRKARSSGNIPTDRIYDLYRRNTAAFRRLGKGANRFLGREGFALRLFSPDGTLVDVVGNLDGRQTHDTPRWALPEGWTETGARTSLIRGYDARVPRLGTLPGSFVRAADTALLKGYSYWGLPTDDGTPGYRQGSPLPVTLSNVRADRVEGGVVVRWSTASEMENAGFYVLRRWDSQAGFVKVNPTLIPGAGTTAERSTYTYRDTTAQPNVPYYYRLEEVSLSGERRTVATVRLRGHLSAAGKTLWRWADVKSRDYWNRNVF